MQRIKAFFLLVVAMLAALFFYDSFMPPVSTLMMARTLTLHSVTRAYMPLRRISPSLMHAVIAAEDGKFCQHHGVDWKALSTVVETMRDEDADAARGASTITMQTTKNLFLWTGHSYLRKGLEIPLALGLDLFWTKHRIMENYLNIAEFGPGLFGAEAAARHYFHKSARALTTHEAALLAAALPAPLHRNPANPSDYMKDYAATIEERASKVDASCLR